MVRTCLFNYAYARHVGGTFVFRIEDTDAARDSEDSFDAIVDSLTWMGLEWDEGVGVGGPHGPYRQSERGEIYRDVAAKLLAGGYAYESFSTPEEIEERHRAAGRDPKLGYDGFDRGLTEEQKAAYRAEGRKPVIRMRMPDADVSFTDLVRGEIVFKAGSVPDYVIVRANGDPLYTLTNPVDDAMMEITDVLRGEDLLSSTPRQIVLYRALEELGVAKFTPRLGHLLHRERGVIPEGLLNYLALLGWAIGPDNDVFTKDEMVAAFEIDAVNPNPARFDEKKCTAINAEHIRRLDVADYASRLVPFLAREGIVGSDKYEGLTDAERRILDAAAPLAQTRMQLLGEAPDLLRFLFVGAEDVVYNEKAVAKLKDSAPAALAGAAEAVRSMESFTPEELKEALDAKLVEGMGIKPRLAFGPLFVAMTGTNVSIPVVDSMAILGKDEALARIERLLARL